MLLTFIVRIIGINLQTNDSVIIHTYIILLTFHICEQLVNVFLIKRKIIAIKYALSLLVEFNIYLLLYNTIARKG